MTQETTTTDGLSCVKQPDFDLSNVKTVELNPTVALKDYLEATEMAKEEALEHMDDYMLMSWSDRDRDFESP